MIHYHKALTAFLAAVLISAAAPAAIYAADGATTVPSGTTPMNTNLIQNSGFEQTATDGSIPNWTPTGTAHVETFGTKPWPSQVYANKWKGGLRYLTCGKTSGQVSQTVPFVGAGNIVVRLSSYFGGTIGHKILVAITVTGNTNDPNATTYKQDVRVLDITNHYKKAVVTTVVPFGATSITATIQLLPADGAAKCKMVADTVDMWVFPPTN